MVQKITTEECAEEVRLMARRAALLHYYFSKAIVDKLGEEEGRELIKEAIWNYGDHCGKVVREGVEELGLPIMEENYSRVRDLPNYGWEAETVPAEDGEDHLVVTHCPLAATFQELGPEGVSLGRLYCHVDQAKYQAYDPTKTFVHARNVLDGDPYCQFEINPKGSE
jgi:hypothetical protein